MGKGEGSSAATLSGAVARAHMRQKSLCGIRRWRLGVGGRNKLAAVVVRATREDFSPGFVVGRCQVVPISEDVDLVPEYAPALTPDGNGNGWKQR